MLVSDSTSPNSNGVDLFGFKHFLVSGQPIYSPETGVTHTSVCGGPSAIFFFDSSFAFGHAITMTCPGGPGTDCGGPPPLNRNYGSGSGSGTVGGADVQISITPV